MAELGSTTDPIALVPGNEATVRGDATALGNRAAQLETAAQTFASVRVPGWTGTSADRFEVAVGALPRSWRTTADALTSAAAQLTAYATALNGAQADAAAAIELWAQGEAATAAAEQSYTSKVNAYERSFDKPNPTPYPGPFVDPGATLRQEARDLLADARAAVTTAGDDAADTLAEIVVSDSPIVHNQAGWQGPDVSGSTSGSLFTYDPDSGDRKLDLAKAEGQASLFSADASTEAKSGSLFAKAEASTMVGAKGEAAFGVADGTFQATAEGSVGVHADASARAGHEHASVGVSTSGLAGAHAEAGVHLGKEGIKAEAGAFAGAKGEIGADAEVAGVGGEVGVEGWAGIGAEFDGGVGRNKDGSWTMEVKAGAALGLGGSGSMAITIDPQGVLDAADDAVDWVGSLF